MHPLLIALIMFFAIFKQSVAGFGTALISMPLLAQHYTPFVWQSFLFAFPGAMLRLAARISLDKYINPTLFRKSVLILLLVLGLNLIF